MEAELAADFWENLSGCSAFCSDLNFISSFLGSISNRSMLKPALKRGNNTGNWKRRIPIEELEVAELRVQRQHMVALIANVLADERGLAVQAAQ